MSSIELVDLVGMHVIHGIGQGLVSEGKSYGSDDQARLVLLMDESVVEFTEGFSDGYRSSLGSVIMESPSRYDADPTHAISIAVIHPPLVVSMRHRVKGSWDGERADVIYAINERTDLVVLEIGTDNIDDYYPSFIYRWQPEGWTPEWLEASVGGVTVTDSKGRPWILLDDFASHAEAAKLKEARMGARTSWLSGSPKNVRVKDVRVVHNKETNRYEVWKQLGPNGR